MSVLLTILLDATVQALGPQGFADVSPVQQDPVVGLETQILGDVAHEVSLHIVGSLAL